MLILNRFYVIALLILLFTACVTINVYFPAAAAEKAADQIIDQIQGTQSQPHQPSEPNTAPSNETPPSQSTLVPTVTDWQTSLFNQIIAPVRAEEANLDISSPTIQTIVTRQAERYQKLESFYTNGAIGLTHDGLIVVRDPTQISLRSRNDVNRWVADENQDRLALYREIAIANKHPEWEGNIRLTFANRWIERALPGWWYQDEKSQWKRK